MQGEYSSHQAQNLITILAHDPKHGKIVAQLIRPELFDGVLRNIAEKCVHFWKRYKTCPGVHTADLFSDILDKDDRTAKVYRKVLRNMHLLSEGINTEYVISTLRSTTHRYLMKDMVLKVAEIAQQETIDIQEADTLIRAFVKKQDVSFDPGLRLTDVDKVVDWLQTHYNEFKLGIEVLDNAHVVPSRGAVLLFIAPAGKGKSWFLANTAKHAILRRKRVAHFTLEMPSEESAARYYQAFFAIPKRGDDVELFDIDKDGQGRFTKPLGSRVYTPKITMQHPKIRRILKERMKYWEDRGIGELLVIKRFPPRGVTIDHLAAYLDALEASTGFIPDMCILDYVGIVKTNADNHRITLGRLFEDFRGLCVERNMAGVTAQQGNRKSSKAYQVGTDHVAEDWSLMGTADVAFTFSQTQKEKDRGLARLWVGKARGEPDNWGLIVTQNYATGQFALQSARLSRKYDDMIESLNKRAEDEDEKEEE